MTTLEAHAIRQVALAQRRWRQPQYQIYPDIGNCRCLVNGKLYSWQELQFVTYQEYFDWLLLVAGETQ